MVSSFIYIHTKVCIYCIKETICNRAKSGSELPESVAPILRNDNSQNPDRWLKEPRNNNLKIKNCIKHCFPTLFHDKIKEKGELAS